MSDAPAPMLRPPQVRFLMTTFEPSFVFPQMPPAAVVVKSRNAGSAELNMVVVVVLDVVVVVVEVVVLDVVLVVVVWVVEVVVLVVVVVGVSTSAMKAATQLSVMFSRAPWLPSGA